MQLTHSDSDIFIPDGSDLQSALARGQGGAMGIGAHQDDLEIFAMHGIGACFGRTDRLFTGVTVTNGGGSARKGKYQNLTDDQMMETRRKEQQAAARLGQYAAQFQLGYPSSDIKGASPVQGRELIDDLYAILSAVKPESVYLHSPFDKHESHNAVTRAALCALRKLPPGDQPKTVYGCEVWRAFDWLPDTMKLCLDVTAYQDLQERLIACHDSQVEGSKDYVRATLGRQFANATFFKAHIVDDGVRALTYAVDLRPFLDDPALTMDSFSRRYLSAFTNQILSRASEYELKI